MSSMMKSIAGQPIAVNVSLISTIPSHCERSTIEHIFLLCLVVVGRDLDVKLIAQRYGGRHPDLAQFVVAVALEAVCELLAMHFQVIGEAKPLDGEQEHPVHSLL